MRRNCGFVIGRLERLYPKGSFGGGRQRPVFQMEKPRGEPEIGPVHKRVEQQRGGRYSTTRFSAGGNSSRMPKIRCFFWGINCSKNI
jgi:hypothetical protein